MTASSWLDLRSLRPFAERSSCEEARKATALVGRMKDPQPAVDVASATPLIPRRYLYPDFCEGQQVGVVSMTKPKEDKEE